jgi:hypothetical protein
MRFIYPPRPKGKINPPQLPTYQDGRWVVQRKFNDTRNGIAISADRSVVMYNRHGEIHKQFIPSEDILRQVLALNLEPGLEYWLDGGLLHAKTTDPTYKNRLILYDILYAGRYLFNTHTTLQRLQMLKEICRNPTHREPGRGIALMVSPNIWMAETFDVDFVPRYNDFLDMDEIEGLVLKKSGSFIDNMGTKQYEIPWQIRCRKPNANYNS